MDLKELSPMGDFASRNVQEQAQDALSAATYILGATTDEEQVSSKAAEAIRGNVLDLVASLGAIVFIVQEHEKRSDDRIRALEGDLLQERESREEWQRRAEHLSGPYLANRRDLMQRLGGLVDVAESNLKFLPTDPEKDAPDHLKAVDVLQNVSSQIQRIRDDYAESSREEG